MHDDLTRFRVLLAVGAVVALLGGLASFASVNFLDSWLGLTGVPSAPGVSVLSRLLGAVSLAVGVGYVLAAIDPTRQRSLLAVLFVAPLGSMLASLIGVVSNSMSGVRGSALAAFGLAYCLVYVRLYPRPRNQASLPPSR